MFGNRETPLVVTFIGWRRKMATCLVVAVHRHGIPGAFMTYFQYTAGQDFFHHNPSQPDAVLNDLDEFPKSLSLDETLSRQTSDWMPGMLFFPG